MSVTFQFHLVYMHAARKLDECEGLQVPAKVKPVKQMPIPEKIQAGDIFCWKKFLDFLRLSLYPWKFWRKQSFIPGNSTIFCYTRWKFQCHPKTKTYRNSLWIFLSPLEIPLLFYLNPVISPCSFYIQYHWQFCVLNTLCCLDFFWNGPITELCVVVLFTQKYHWGLCT